MNQTREDADQKAKREQALEKIKALSGTFEVEEFDRDACHDRGVVTADPTLELLKAIRADIAGVKAAQATTNLWLASLEDKLSGK